MDSLSIVVCILIGALQGAIVCFLVSRLNRPDSIFINIGFSMSCSFLVISIEGFSGFMYYLASLILFSLAWLLSSMLKG